MRSRKLNVFAYGIMFHSVVRLAEKISLVPKLSRTENSATSYVYSVLVNNISG